jgi:hypothetical protein
MFYKSWSVYNHLYTRICYTIILYLFALIVYVTKRIYFFPHFLFKWLLPSVCCFLKLILGNIHNKKNTNLLFLKTLET